MISRFSLKWYLRIFTTLLFMIIFVGGITRLTRSGLSITEWKVVTGILPPLSEESWQQSFDLYKISPEAQQINSHFQLSDYKKIFFWEWVHRLLARIIFLWAFIGGIILYKNKKAPTQLVVLLPLLVATQGLIGWLMVLSGLQNSPHVSPYMLAIHFTFALGTGVFAHYYQSKLRAPLLVSFNKTDWLLVKGLGILLLLQIFYGCLVSGLKAGFMFNTYPLMAGQFLPQGAYYMPTFWQNILENPTIVQWIHRWLGICLFVYLIAITFRLLKKGTDNNLQLPIYHFWGIILTQIILGIITLLTLVNTLMAALHQLCGAMIVITYFGFYFRLKNKTEH